MTTVVSRRFAIFSFFYFSVPLVSRNVYFYEDEAELKTTDYLQIKIVLFIEYSLGHFHSWANIVKLKGQAGCYYSVSLNCF